MRVSYNKGGNNIPNGAFKIPSQMFEIKSSLNLIRGLTIVNKHSRRIPYGDPNDYYTLFQFFFSCLKVKYQKFLSNSKQIVCFIS